MIFSNFKYLSAIYVCLSASTALCQTGDKDAPKFVYDSGTGVDLQQLEFFYKNNDISIGNISLTRNYSSEKYRSYQYFSDFWSHNFDIWVSSNWVSNEQYVLVTIGDRSYRFDGTYAQNYPDNYSVGTYLDFVDGAPVYTDKDGTRYQFNKGSSSSQVSSMIKPNGETFKFSYRDNLLAEVRSNTGFMIAFVYNTAKHITSICTYNLAREFVAEFQGCDKSRFTAHYSYNSDKLARYTTPDGKDATYSYLSGSGLLTCPTKPGSSTCEVFNEFASVNSWSRGGVIRQTFADGEVWKFDCSCGKNRESDPNDPYVQEWTTIDKGGSRKLSYTFIQDGLSESTNELGYSDKWEFYGKFPMSHTDPQGKKYTWLYNSDRLVSAGYIISPKAGSNSDELKVSYSVSKTCDNRSTCNQPTKITDAKLAETEFTYTAFGAVESEMKPSPSANSGRPLILYDYSQRYAYIKDSSGNFIPAGGPIWLKSSETRCQTASNTTQPKCDPNSPKVVTSFEYGSNESSNNLLLRGIVVSAGSESRRTCYAYDYAGNRISETKPRGAGETVCP